MLYRLSGFSLEGNDDFTHRCAEIIEYLIRAIINTSVVRILSFVILYNSKIDAYECCRMKWKRSNKIKHKFLSFFYFLNKRYGVLYRLGIEGNISFIRDIVSFSSKIGNLLSRTF